jgi:phosphate/phosphite/phosphonate ABC transporter binding protein
MNKTIFIILACAFALAVISFVTFVGLSTGPQSKFEIKSDESVVLFAVTPWGDPRQVKDAYRPLLQYLSEKTGKKFQLLIMEDYDVALDNIVEGNIDVCVISAVPYVKAVQRGAQIQYISTIMRDQGGRMAATFKGYLIALKSKYAGMTFDDFLKHQQRYNFAFVTKASASGYAYPMAMMKKRDIDPYKAFKSVTVFENHPSMIDALVAGRIDLGATWEYSLEQARAKYGDIFSIAYTTHDIPSLSWVASKKVDKALVDKIRQVLLELNESGEIKEKLLKDTPDKGWAVIDQSHYDQVSEVLQYVGDFK